MTAVKFLIVLIFLNLLWNDCTGARILAVLPTPSISHQVIYRPILRELAIRGHEVVAIVPDPINDPTLTNLKEINIHNVSYNTWIEENRLTETRVEKESSFQSFKHVTNVLLKICDQELAHEEVEKLINDPFQHFDLVINEWLMYASTFAFGERFKCPIIGISSMPLFISGYESIGAPTHPAYGLDFWKLSGNDLSIWERIDNLFYSVWFRFYYHFVLLPRHDEVAKKHFGNDLKYIGDIEKDVSLILVNTNPVFHVSRPLPPNLIEIGGIHEQTLEKEFSKDLQQFLDGAEYGVIYFSLGSNVKSSGLPQATLDCFMKVFEKLRYRVLWKFEEDLTHNIKNLRVEQWVSQKRVLGHPKVKLFITQGGLQSIEESIRHYVPMVGIPFAGDQDHNVDRINRLGIGKRLYLEDLTVETLNQTILEVLQTKSYKHNIQDLSEAFWHKPIDPLHHAIFWIEYVIRHKGAARLRSPLVDMPWYKYLLLDILGLLALGLIILGCLLRVTLRVIFRNLGNHRTKNRKNKNVLSNKRKKN